MPEKSIHKQRINAILLLVTNVLIGGLAYYFLDNYTVADPEYLWILLFIPIISVYYIWMDKNRLPSLKFSGSSFFIKRSNRFYPYLNGVLQALKMIGFSFLVFALARPQSQIGWQDIETQGIDIIIAMDVSASMLARDFSPNRLQASKRVAIEFIDKRPNDRMGLVVYEGEAFTQCPLTTDHSVLKKLFDDVDTGLLERGTAVGMGIGTAINRLKESEAISKVIILLTDGVNNQGSISPITAAEIAKEYGIRIYTVGVGTNGLANSPVAIQPNGQYVFDYVAVKIDEETLKKVAAMTDGKYFRATNESKLKKIYEEIDQLEKTKIKVTEHNKKDEQFLPFAVIGLISIFLSTLIKDIFIQRL